MKTQTLESNEEHGQYYKKLRYYSEECRNFHIDTDIHMCGKSERSIGYTQGTNKPREYVKERVTLRKKWEKDFFVYFHFLDLVLSERVQ